MKRSLLAQMCHEWRSNIWLVVEILIVMMVVWAALTFTIFTINRLNEPKGFDEHDVYVLNIDYLNEESPEFTDMGEATDQYNYLDQKTILQRLRSNQYVEAAAFADNAVPYILNYQGSGYWLADSGDSVMYSCNVRYASPDIIRVYRIQSETGKSLSQLEKMMRNGEILIARNPRYDEQNRDTKDLVGKYLMTSDSTYRMKVGDMVHLIKRSEFEPVYDGMALRPIDESMQNGPRYNNIVLRVKPGMGKKFAENFYSDPKLRQQRNVILSSLTSLESKRFITQRSDMTTFRSIIGVTLLFLIMVFLGILGSFWYRVQQRHSEIAMRKVCGATRIQIFTRLLSEGSILLLCSLILSAIMAYIIIHFFGFMIYEFGDLPFIIFCGLLAAAVMELMIALGIFFPARRAMKVEPAVALKDE